MGSLEIDNMEELKRSYAFWVEESLKFGHLQHEPRWTQSIAVGSEAFVKKVKAELRATGREVMEEDGTFQLREPQASYDGVFDSENAALRLENTYFWNVSN